MKKQPEYNEVEETARDNRFMVAVVLPVMIILLVIAAVWTYANMVAGIVG